MCKNLVRFFGKPEQNLNTPQNNSSSWELQMGFNSAFKGLMGCKLVCSVTWHKRLFSFYGLPHKRKGWFSYPQIMWQLGIARAIKFSFFMFYHIKTQGMVFFSAKYGTTRDCKGNKICVILTRRRPPLSQWCHTWPCTGYVAQVGSSGTRIVSWPGPTIRTESLVWFVSVSAGKVPWSYLVYVTTVFFQFIIHWWSYRW